MCQGTLGTILYLPVVGLPIFVQGFDGQTQNDSLDIGHFWREHAHFLGESSFVSCFSLYVDQLHKHN